MSTGTSRVTGSRGRSDDPRSTEQRAEDMMERVVSEGSRMLGKAFGRLREELEDIVAEARTMHDRSRQPNRK